MLLRLCYLAVLVLVSPLPCHADNVEHPFLSPLFTDNMVLQRGVSDRAWGWSAPGEHVQVSIAGKAAAATAGSDGKWSADLLVLSEGGLYDLSVTCSATIMLHNVLVGDVWLCSGQSNMEFGIGNTDNASVEIAAANYQQIRLFKLTDKVALAPTCGVAGEWLPCRPDTVIRGGWNGFSAVG